MSNPLVILALIVAVVAALGAAFMAWAIWARDRDWSQAQAAYRRMMNRDAWLGDGSGHGSYHE